jgi:hypothetical protein
LRRSSVTSRERGVTAVTLSSGTVSTKRSLLGAFFRLKAEATGQ